MGREGKILPSSFVVVLTLFLLSNGLASVRAASSPAKGLHKYGEIHEAKNIIDALSSKLHLNLNTYQSKYETLKQQSHKYLAQAGSMRGEMRMLNKLKGLLNELTKKSSACEKFYTNFDFTVARPILFKGVSLPKFFTVALQVNHRSLIDKGEALANGNDLRVYFQKDAEDCRPREIDRILENVATTKTTVLFKLQEDVSQSGSTYYLVYGNKDAGKPKQNPEHVYLFYDDFTDTKLERKWQKNWGTVRVENGVLTVRTGKTPTNEHVEISVFVRHGYDWEDIEVELDFLDRNKDKYPGPFLRVQDAGLKSTSGWWFEYHTGNKRCTMRPLKSNNDGSWLYRGNLNKPLSLVSWTHAKYRVVGDRFSHWINNKIVHNNVQVASKWMITKGTFGLGCHKDSTGRGCQTSYDNIKIRKYVPVLPTVSLGKECKVDLKKFYGLGASKKNPATSCRQIHDVSLYDGTHRLKNGVYWIKTSADRAAPTFCDLENGGWTLAGKVGGSAKRLYSFWLVKNSNVAALRNTGLPSGVGCIDARYLATYHASTVMLSSGENKKGIGAKWVQWSLPEERKSNTLWTHSVGYGAVSKAKMHLVTVKAWDGSKNACYQNKFGIIPLRRHGGSYPAATFNKAGNTRVNDFCMAVGVQKKGTTVHGWTQGANGYDSPRSNADWPNAKYNHGSPYVTVWLK